MIVPALISNVLLVEEAAAAEEKKNQATFFQRESRGRFGRNWHQTWSQSSSIKGFGTKYHPSVVLICDKDVLLEVTSVNGRLFARKCPRYNRR